MPHIATECEITVEANPSSLSMQKAETLLRLGANRLSIGLQSLRDEKLRFLSRIHNAKMAQNAYKNARDAGFTNISVDLIFDTPFDDEAALRNELELFCALDVQHISAYSLTIEEQTPFATKGIQSRDSAEAAQLVETVLRENGFTHYEVSSYAKRRSVHNSRYWAYHEYIGVGAGAVGMRNARRIYPPRDIDSYINNPLRYSFETIREDEKRTEMLFLGLRCDSGAPLSLFDKNDKNLLMLEREGIIRIDTTRIFATNLFLADEIALRLI